MYPLESNGQPSKAVCSPWNTYPIRYSHHHFSYGGIPELSRILAIFSASQLRHQLIAEAVFDLKPHAAEHLHS